MLRTGPEAETSGSIAACPALGIEDDRATHCWHPSPRHRCFRPERPFPPSPEQQTAHCLSGRFSECAVFLGRARIPSGRGLGRRRRVVAAGALAVAAVVACAALVARPGGSPSAAPRGPTVPAAEATVQSGFQRYVVKPGDTLQAITDFFGVHPDDVVWLNNLERGRPLTPGTTLVIPPPQPPR